MDDSYLIALSSCFGLTFGGPCNNFASCWNQAFAGLKSVYNVSPHSAYVCDPVLLPTESWVRLG